MSCPHRDVDNLQNLATLHLPPAVTGQDSSNPHVATNHMAQELGLSCQQVALGRIQPQPCRPDGGKYISQVKQGPVISMHQQVVEVHNAVAVGYICQHPLHQPLKSSWCIAEPKWHDTELPQPLPDGEGSLWSCVRGQLHLQVATAQVKRAEPAGPAKSSFLVAKISTKSSRRHFNRWHC